MTIALRPLEGRNRAYYLLLAALLATIALALGAVWRMEHEGHIVTGMTNQVVWGLPHVFAVFLVVAASGALNIASIASVFGQTAYKPLAPLSGLLAIALLVGGLCVLMLDLGRPDRLIVAMTHYNFKSIFAWNVILYTGFMALVTVYLWTMMERRMNRFTPVAGMAAFLWRVALTTGTGSIFGFLVARQAFDSALLAPMFIVLSLAYGKAVFLLVLIAVSHWSARPLGKTLLRRFARLQVIFIGAAFYFMLVYHLTNLYFTRHHGFEQFILQNGGIYTTLFWGGQVLVGMVAPLVLLLHPATRGRVRTVVASSALVITGALAQMYVTIIGGQAFPLVLFPGRQVSSSFHDGMVNPYTPSLPEWLLGLGGVAMAALIVLVAIRFLGFLPERLDDPAMDAELARPASASP